MKELFWFTGQWHKGLIGRWSQKVHIFKCLFGMARQVKKGWTYSHGFFSFLILGPQKCACCPVVMTVVASAFSSPFRRSMQQKVHFGILNNRSNEFVGVNFCVLQWTDRPQTDIDLSGEDKH